MCARGATKTVADVYLLFTLVSLRGRVTPVHHVTAEDVLGAVLLQETDMQKRRSRGGGVDAVTDMSRNRGDGSWLARFRRWAEKGQQFPR